MNGEKRRQQILEILGSGSRPVSGMELAKQTHVSRQVIVQDIAILRANGHEVIATNRGYLSRPGERPNRVFKVRHEDDQIEQELNDIVDLGGYIVDVFVYHKVYGVIRADMNVKSRRDVAQYMEKIRTGKSTPLKNVTAGYHYHTVAADDNRTLDLIQEKLEQEGYLAKLQEYEPVDFWSGPVNRIS